MTTQLPLHLLNLSKSDLEGMCVNCGLCLAPDTLILYEDMVWRPIGEAKIGDVILGFDEESSKASHRKLRTSVIEDVVWSRKETIILTVGNKTVITTPEHRWLTKQRGWKRTDKLTDNNFLKDIGVHTSPTFDEDYKLGYIAGMTEGDGTYRFKTPGKHHYWRVALMDHEPIWRLYTYMQSLGAIIKPPMPFINSPTSFSPGKELLQVRFANKEGMAVIARALMPKNSDEYARGYLAGIFDAEGSYHERHLRVSQHGTELLNRVVGFGERIGLTFRLETPCHPISEEYHTIVLVGGISAHLEFFTKCAPAISRKRDWLKGKRLQGEHVPVSMSPGPVMDVVDIQTSTATFFANGIATHNCCTAQVQVEKGFNILVPELRCKFLVTKSDTGEMCCSTYETRLEVAKGWCNPLADAIKKGLFPKACPYVSEMMDYVGTVVLSDKAYANARPALRKALEGPKPAWTSDNDWKDFTKNEND